MGDVLDLDARRAARREAQGDNPRFTLAGTEYELPYELPFAFVTHGREGDFKAALAVLVGEDQADALLDGGLTDSDLQDIVEYAYGAKAGESLASTNTSPTSGKQSRPTSNASTGSTSEKRSTAPVA